MVDAGVAGYAGDLLGQRVGALLVLADHASPAPSAEDIIAWVSQRLASYKVPERIQFVTAIPRNAVTKIDRLAISQALKP